MLERRMTKHSPHRCVDCGTHVPPQDDESALISMKYGWRLTRRVDEQGTATLEWRCPKCWVLYRDQRGPGDSSRSRGRSDGR
jgi:hypothetical protein